MHACKSGRCVGLASLLAGGVTLCSCTLVLVCEGEEGAAGKEASIYEGRGVRGGREGMSAGSIFYDQRTCLTPSFESE